MRSPGKSFTIVELMVVIAIITILASLTVPAVFRAKAVARSARCKANLRAVGPAMRIYLNQSNDVMPVAAQMPSLKLNEDPPIADVLAPYLQDARALQCPEDTRVDYFAREGSSYEYRSTLGGQKVGDSFLTRRWGEGRTHVMYDYEPFHGEPATPGAANYLFADGHVGDLN